MKIYTKTGDSGMTSLLGGSRVPKYHLRIESYGTIDELNSHLGLLNAYGLSSDLKNELLHIQELLFSMGSSLASEPGKESSMIPKITESDVHYLELSIDRMENELEPLRNFILPGGHLAVAQAHISRCVCRRAERLVLALNDESAVDETIRIFLNRLSDYLFVLSRFIGKELSVAEIPWAPNRN